MISFEWVNENNYIECEKIRKSLFDYDFHGNIYERVAMKKDLDDYARIDYTIVKDEGKSIGTIGYYISAKSPDRCWVGWYGILSDFRGMGYGDKILSAYIDFIKENVKEAKFLYVYTDFDECKSAIHGYEKHGMILEEGKFYKDSHCDRWCILGMPLGDYKYETWGKDPVWCED